jgi:hypothetical protein
MQRGADRFGELSLDQRLIDRLGRGTVPVTDIGDLSVRRWPG